MIPRTGYSDIDDLFERLDEAGVHLWVDGQDLRYRAPVGALTPELSAEIRSAKARILASTPRTTGVPGAAGGASGEPFPLTDVQSAYLLGRTEAFAYSGVGCHLYLELRTRRLNVVRLEEAWNQLIVDHPMMRAVMLKEGGQRVQAEVDWLSIPISDEGVGDNGASRLATRAEMSHRLYDPFTWPLHDLRITRQTDHDVLHFSIDMLIADGHSVNLILHELGERYGGWRDIAPPSGTFRDYVIRSTCASSTEVTTRRELDRQYWLDRIGTLPNGPGLPTLPTAAVSNARFSRRERVLDAESWRALQSAAASRGLSPSSAVLTVYAEIIGRWSRHPEFCINVTNLAARQEASDLPRVIGDFTSVCLLEVTRKPRAATWVERARDLQGQLWTDLAHPLFSGVEVIRELSRNKGSGAALMPVVFTSMIGQPQLISSPESLMSDARVEFGVTQTPQVWLDCQLREDSEALRVVWDVRDGVFPEDMVDDAFDCFIGYLSMLATDTGSWHEPPSRCLPAKSAAVRDRVNSTEAPPPTGLLHDAVIRAAMKSPMQIAIVTPSQSLTYSQLLQGAQRIAYHLSNLGVGPGDFVAISLEKGAEQVVTVVGVLMCGAAYVPVDTFQPVYRRAVIIRDCGAHIVITHGRFSDEEWPECAVVLSVEDLVAQEINPVPLRRATPEDLAYVIYTSGSTGSPKGVMISHEAALNTVVDLNRRWDVSSNDRGLALAHLGFDLSVFDIFGPLGAGGSVVIPDPEGRGDPSHWAALITLYGVTLWNSVPAQMQMLVSHLASVGSYDMSSLRVAWLSGDWIPVSLPDEIRRYIPGLEVVSLGGATEASIWSIYHPVGVITPDASSIPYGIPLTNQTFHVLDHDLADRPDWVAGELYIGGLGLSKGYISDPVKTAERFITHPGDGRRLYRTGDWGRYRPDGVIEFLGREDHQVKLRGHRIELAEVEHALLGTELVDWATVLVHGDSPSERRLIAFARLASGTGTDVRPQVRAAMISAVDAIEDVPFGLFEDFQRAAERVSCLAMLECFLEAGAFRSGTALRDELLALAAPRNQRLMKRWISTLVGAGYLQLEVDGESFSLAQSMAPSLAQSAWAEWEDLDARLDFGSETLAFVRACSGHLGPLIRDEIDPNELLFPQGELATARAAYRDNRVGRLLNEYVASAVLAICTSHLDGRPVRILEVGAGVGGTTESVLEKLSSVNVNYTFSDVSNFFLNHARLRYRNDARVGFAVVDINEDFRTQGLVPNSYEIILAANVLHNSEDLPSVLVGMRELLAPQGWLVIIEAVRDSAPLMVSMEFQRGLSRHFRDFRAGSDRVFATEGEWLTALGDAGFGDPVVLPEHKAWASLAGQRVIAAMAKPDRVHAHDSDVLAAMTDRVPGYMIPSAIQLIDTIPTTDNGKVDRACLSNWVGGQGNTTANPGEAPRDELELRISQIWAEVLRSEKVTRDEDFFAAGGDSLLMAQFVGQLRALIPEAEAAGWDSLLRATLRAPTVAGVADTLRNLNDAGSGTARKVLLRTLAAGRDDVAYVMVHDGSGNTTRYRHIVQTLADQSGPTILGLDVGDSLGYLRRPVMDLIDALGDEYAVETLKARNGKLHLVGFCIGGFVASAMARRLLALGRQPASLTVIDSYRFPYAIENPLMVEYLFARAVGVEPIALGYPTVDQLAPAIRAMFPSGDGREPSAHDIGVSEIGMLAESLERLNDIGRDARLESIAHAVGPSVTQSDLDSALRLFRHSMVGVHQHRVKAYRGNITLIRQRQEDLLFDGMSVTMTDSWQSACLGELRVIDVGGDHFTCLQPPHASEIARVLQRLAGC